MPGCEGKVFVFIGVVDGSLDVDDDRVVTNDFGGNINRYDREHRVPEQGQTDNMRGQTGAAQNRGKRETGEHSRNKQELELVLHALDRLLHQVHVLAAVAQRVLTTRVEMYDPMHWQLS